jgi:PhnB protein
MESYGESEPEGGNMPQNPPEGYTRVTPYLYYKDSAAALDFLTTAFGFTEKIRMPDEAGGVSHAEIELGDGVVMFGSPGKGYKNPKELGVATQNVYVYVDDVDAHYEHAKAAGAEIVREPEDQFYGDRSYGATDPEGHEWYFATHVREVSPEEMQAAMAGAEAG